MSLTPFEEIFHFWEFSFLGLPLILKTPCKMHAKYEVKTRRNKHMPTKYVFPRKTLFHGGTFFQPGNRSCKFFRLDFRQLFGLAFVKHPFPEMHTKYGVKTRRNKHMPTKYVLPHKTTTVKSAGHIQTFDKCFELGFQQLLSVSHFNNVHKQTMWECGGWTLHCVPTRCVFEASWTDLNWPRWKWANSQTEFGF